MDELKWYRCLTRYTEDRLTVHILLMADRGFGYDWIQVLITLLVCYARMPRLFGSCCYAQVPFGPTRAATR